MQFQMQPLKRIQAQNCSCINFSVTNFQAEVPEDIYPNCKVEDLKKGIIGSCSTYDTRKDVTDLIRLLEYKDVEERYVTVNKVCVRNKFLPACSMQALSSVCGMGHKEGKFPEPDMGSPNLKQFIIKVNNNVSYRFHLDSI